MFAKKEKDYVTVGSSKLNIPSGEFSSTNKEILEKTHQLVKLIEEKYNFKSQHVEIKGRFDTLNPNFVKIVLLNMLPGQTPDKANIKPIEFLKIFGGTADIEPHKKHSYWSKSVITVEVSKLDDAIAGLNLLNTPDEPSGPRLVARC